MQIKLSERAYAKGSEVQDFTDVTKQLINSISSKAHELGVTVDWRSAEFDTEMNLVDVRGFMSGPVIEYRPVYTLKVVAE